MIACRPVRGLCFEFGRDPGRCRCVSASARAVPCGSLLAAAEVAIKVARRAIAPMSAHAAGGHRQARMRHTWVSCGVLLTFWGCIVCLEWMLGLPWSA